MQCSINPASNLKVLGQMTWLMGLCSPGVALQGGLLFGLFLAGAAGSVMHCAPMCGAFVLGQVSDRMARLPAGALCERQRITSGFLLPYHMGRLTTYAALGAVVARSASLLGGAAWFGAVSGGLLVLAALLFLAQALRRVLPAAFAASFGLDRAPGFWMRWIRQATRRIPRHSVVGEYALGATLGFLPCGFLYAALAAAASSSQPAMGAAAMLAFGLGTTPSLIVVGIAGQAAGRRWSRAITAAAPALMALNAMLLLALAWQQIA